MLIFTAAARRQAILLASLLASMAGCAAPGATDQQPGVPSETVVMPSATMRAWTTASTPNAEHCDVDAYESAARYNQAALTNLVFSPFGRTENGWAIYTPLIQQSLQTRCGPASGGFAAAVARWQTLMGQPANGAVTPETFLTLKGVWQERRPFVMLRVQGVCPKGADAVDLETLAPGETLGEKPVMLRRNALLALRHMTASAQGDLGAAAGGDDGLKVFSGYRDPVSDAARCLKEQNCQGVVRAECSAHRTGLAVDLDVGSAPGFPPDSSADPNRLYQSQTALYQWLVQRGADFGFVNYPFEPWHWEWTGEAP